MGFEAEKRELQQQISNLVRDKFAGDYKTAFEYYDRQPKDGKINRDELVELLSDAQIGNWITRGRWADGIIAELDADSDGSIGWSEFQSVLK